MTVSRAPGPVTRVTSRDFLQPFFQLYVGLSFVSLFWPPGPAKRSIVANLAPKMTPKWSLKWSQSDNGRPLRNMHRHLRIAHPPPLGELNFTASLETEKSNQKSRTKLPFQNVAPNWAQKYPSLEPDPCERISPFWSFLLWPPLGAPVEHRDPKSHSRSSKMSPKMDENHGKVASKSRKSAKKQQRMDTRF